MKRKSVIILILSILSLFLFLNSIKNDLTLYRTNVHLSDVHINDIRLISDGKSLVIPGGYTFNNIFDGKVEDVSLQLLYNNKRVTDWVFQFDHRQSFVEDNDLIFNNISLKESGEISFKITYLNNGEKKEIQKKIVLEDIIVNY